MTTRETAKRHADELSNLAERIERTRNPLEAVRLSRQLRDETHQLAVEVAQVQAEEREGITIG
jgi:hypothetical protein